jgi:hypothetical protein
MHHIYAATSVPHFRQQRPSAPATLPARAYASIKAAGAAKQRVSAVS